MNVHKFHAKQSNSGMDPDEAAVDGWVDNPIAIILLVNYQESDLLKAKHGPSRHERVAVQELFNVELALRVLFFSSPA